jgi:ABC-type bacteriocin/lantibiotic exporter with double-glycine peptidase domain
MKTILNPYKRLFRLLKTDDKEISQIYIYSFLIGLTNLSLPLGIQAIINLIQMGQVSTSWIVLVGFVVGGVLFGGYLQIAQLKITENIQQKIFIRSSFEFAYRIPKFDAFSIRNKYAPELVNRFFDTVTIQKGLPKLLIDFSTASLQLIFGLILLSVYHPFFIFFSMMILLVLFFIMYLTSKKGLETSLEESKYKYKVAFWLEEVARTMNTFKLAGKTPLPLIRNNELVEGYIIARKSHFKVLLSQYFQLVGFKTLIAFFLLLIGGLLVINQQMNIGQFIAAEIIILLVINSVEKIILNLENLYDVLTAVDKIGEILDIPLEKDNGQIIEEDGQALHITINNLKFRYDNSQSYLFENLSLSISPGQHTAIIGSDNAGKTTLLKIIARLYPVQEGSISYNSLPANDINLEHLRTIIGDYISDQQLFNGTLEHNISMLRPNISMKDIIWASEKTNLLEFIQATKNGFQTFIEPEGYGFSRSLAQKLILARCIVNKPKLLLMDDQQRFTSNSMKETRDLQELLFDKDASWTLVAATKNEHLLHNFHQIIKLDNGKISFQGNYEEYKAKFIKS